MDAGFLLEPFAPGPITVEVPACACQIQREASQNWLWHAFRAFARVEALCQDGGHPVRSFAAIGTGNGVDAIGAAAIFKSLERIAITDIDHDVLAASQLNVVKNVPDRIESSAFLGDVCEPLAEGRRTFDVIYANLPNLPSRKQDLDPRRYFVPRANDEHDKELDRWLLGLQCRLLLSARNVLTDGGRVLLVCGGRFDLSVLDRIACRTGYEFNEIWCAFKKQTHAKAMTQSYAEHEGEILFDFYVYDDASAILSTCTPRATGAEMKHAIKSARLSAAEAHKRACQGTHIGHTVHVISATLSGPKPAESHLKGSRPVAERWDLS